ncbi:MAG: biotin synthase, partial [Limnohabitans sp.]
MSEATLTQRPPSLQSAASDRWAKRPYTASPWLHEEIGARMASRLSWIRLQPQQWLSWWPLHGGMTTHAQVQAQYPQATCFVTEASPQRERNALAMLQGPWWQRWFKPNKVTSTPPQAGQMQMIWANMALHLSDDPQALLKQWHQSLDVDGFLMFSCLGPDTLRELRDVYAQQGWPPPSHDFTDMHDWGDMLVHAGFAEPVMDMERITLTYESPERLLEELRQLGRNFHAQRFAGLRGRTWYQQLQRALLALASPQHNGRLVLTIEVIYGHALKPLPKIKMTGESVIALQ